MLTEEFERASNVTPVSAVAVPTILDATKKQPFRGLKEIEDGELLSGCATLRFQAVATIAHYFKLVTRLSRGQ